MSRRSTFIRFALSLLALAVVIWWGTRQDSPRAPDSAADIGWISLALALYAAATAARAERWLCILRRSGVRVTRSEAHSLTTIGYMGNNVLPARAGEVFRVLLLRREGGHGKRKLAGTIVAERLLDSVVLAVVLVVIVYAFIKNSALPPQRLVHIAAVGLGLLLLGCGFVPLAHRHPRLTSVREFSRPLVEAPRALLRLDSAHLVLATTVIWAFEAAVYLTVGHGVGLEVSPLESLYLVALTNFFAALPAAPGSIGTFDAAAMFGMNAIGAGALAISYLLLLRFVLYVPITLVGLVVLVVRYGGWSRLAEARRATRVERPAPRVLDPRQV